MTIRLAAGAPGTVIVDAFQTSIPSSSTVAGMRRIRPRDNLLRIGGSLRGVGSRVVLDFLSPDTSALPSEKPSPDSTEATSARVSPRAFPDSRRSTVP
ncbi:MAG: hypothetical protein H0U65_02610 [Rubrobacter sp.]|nr:hypothetical protein [Rubrobacter sp.]